MTGARNPPKWQVRWQDLKTGEEAPLIGLSDTKSFLRIDGTGEDALFNILIAAAHDLFEKDTGRALYSRGFRMWFPFFPGTPAPWWEGVREGPETWLTQYNQSDITIRKAPISTYGALTAYDLSQTPNVIPTSVYQASQPDPNQPGRIRLQYGQVWPPIILRTIDGVSLDLTAGYDGSTFLIPNDIKMALYTLVGEMYAKRGDGELMTSTANSVAWPIIRRYALPSVDTAIR